MALRREGTDCYRADLVTSCSGGLIRHVDGTICGCTIEDDVDGCQGLEVLHEDAPEVRWKWYGRCDRCGIIALSD